MLKYCVFFIDREIGRIYEKEGEYKYIPDANELEKLDVEDEHIITPQYRWGKMPKFFEDRITMDPEFKNECRSSYDDIYLRKMR